MHRLFSCWGRSSRRAALLRLLLFVVSMTVFQQQPAGTAAAQHDSGAGDEVRIRDNDGVLHHGLLVVNAANSGSNNSKRSHQRRAITAGKPAPLAYHSTEEVLEISRKYWGELTLADPGGDLAKLLPGADNPLACPKNVYPHGSARVFLNVRYSDPFPMELPASFGRSRLRSDRGEEENNRQWGPICPQALKNPAKQYEFHGDIENCLSLNIFSPAVGQQSSSNQSHQQQLYPVLFFVHGGALLKGSAVELGACGIVENLVHRHRIVVVTVQYRLGVWGWLNFNAYGGDGSDGVPGESVWDSSRGFWDVVVALNWVHRNIASFGGDPRQVTLAGHEAGGCLVSWLTTLAMEPEGLENSWAWHELKLRGNGNVPTNLIDTFNNVILQSGSSVFCTRTGISADNPTSMILKNLCDSPHPFWSVDHCINRKIYEHLAPKNFTELTLQSLYSMLFPMMQLSTGRGGFPRYGESHRGKSRQRKKLNVLMGTTEHEWIYYDADIQEVLGRVPAYEVATHIYTLLQLAKGYFHKDVDLNGDSEMINSLLRYYAGWQKQVDSKSIPHLRVYTRFMTDVIFNIPMLYDANYFTQRGHAVHLYRFGHHTPRELQDIGVVDSLPQLQSNNEDLLLKEVTPHRADLKYLFMGPADKWALMAELYPIDRELAMAHAMSDTWAHFVKHGRPLANNSSDNGNNESHHSFVPSFSSELPWEMNPYIRLGGTGGVGDQEVLITVVRPFNNFSNSSSSVPWHMRIIADEAMARLWDEWLWDRIHVEDD